MATHPCCISIKVRNLDDAGSEDVDCQVVPPSWVTNSCEPPGNIPSWAVKNVGSKQHACAGKGCCCHVAPPLCVIYNPLLVAQPVDALTNTNPDLWPKKGNVAGGVSLPRLGPTAPDFFPLGVRQNSSTKFSCAPPLFPLTPTRLLCGETNPAAVPAT